MKRIVSFAAAALLALPMPAAVSAQELTYPENYKDYQAMIAEHPDFYRIEEDSVYFMPHSLMGDADLIVSSEAGCAVTGVDYGYVFTPEKDGRYVIVLEENMQDGVSNGEIIADVRYKNKHAYVVDVENGAITVSYEGSSDGKTAIDDTPCVEDSLYFSYVNGELPGSYDRYFTTVYGYNRVQSYFCLNSEYQEKLYNTDVTTSDNKVAYCGMQMGVASSVITDDVQALSIVRAVGDGDVVITLNETEDIALTVEGGVLRYAQESGDPPFVPTDFDSALAFWNKYGAVHIENGLLYVMFRETTNTAYSYEVVPTTDVMAEVYYGICEKSAANNKFEIVVYKPFADGTFTVDLHRFYGESSRIDTSYDFAVGTDGSITQTDFRALVPDCITEYGDFLEKNGTVSVQGRYVVYCGDINFSTGSTLNMEQNGTAEFVQIAEIPCVRLDTQPAVSGSTSQMVYVYEAVSDGTVDVTWRVGREWDLENSTVSSVSKQYTVTENGAVISEQSDLMGDCNTDGKLSIIDSIMLQKYLLCTGNLTAPQNADMCEDGVIDAFDLAMMKKMLIEKNAEQTPENMPVIMDYYDAVTDAERENLWKTLSDQYPDMDFSDFTFVHDPDHSLSDYCNGKLFSIYYKNMLLHGYGNINCDANVFAVVGDTNAVNFVVDPKLFAQVDLKQEILSPLDVLPTCIDVETPELILYVDTIGENPPRLAYRAVDVRHDGEYILDAVTGESIEYIPYYVV